MALAGMHLQTMIDAIKTNEEIISDFDARSYLVSQLESTFLDIQTDIIMMIQGNVQEQIEELMT